MHHDIQPILPNPTTESPDGVLANNLLAARVVRGITQQELSATSGISRATIAQLESGYSDPRLSTISELARALGIPPLLLLLGTAEAQALSKLPGKLQASALAVPESDLLRMQHLVSTGMLKDRLRAARLGATVARKAGVASPGESASAAIFSGMVPGAGTVVGALLGQLLAEAKGK